MGQVRKIPTKYAAYIARPGEYECVCPSARPSDGLSVHTRMLPARPTLAVNGMQAKGIFELFKMTHV